MNSSGAIGNLNTAGLNTTNVQTMANRAFPLAAITGHGTLKLALMLALHTYLDCR